MTKPMRLLLTLIAGNVLAGLTFLAGTLLFRDDVVAHLRAARPQTGPAAIDGLLISHQFNVALFVVAFLLIARGLVRGDARSYRWLTVGNALALAGTAYLILSFAYPAWLIPLLAVQAALLVTQAVIAGRPAIRERFAGDCCVPSAA